MKHKCIVVLSLALFCAAAGFPQVTLNPIPSRAIGQPQLIPSSASPNLVEGREFYSPQGLALDTSVSPPILYVADTGNSRILAWKNAASFSNGKPADLVIGQRDFFTTFAQGPGTTLSTGLNSPVGLAVRSGDLYVVDSGNNRVLRYPKPFSQTDQFFPDLVIGQPSLSSNTSRLSEKGVYLSASGAVFPSIAFDTAGNLWLTDVGNRRVLRYGAADISKGGYAPAANLELGQLDFISAQPNLNTIDPTSRLKLNQFAVPSGLAFDAGGRLYVSDSDPSRPDLLSRVLVFNPPFGNGMNASRIMGQFVLPQGAPMPTPSQTGQVVMYSPSGIFFLPGNQGMAVLDYGFSRILIFDPYDQWPDQNTAFSPSAKAVVGQGNDFTKLNPNNGNPKPSESTFAGPLAAVLFNNELYMADSGNNRVIVMPLQSGTFGSATRVLGQDGFDTNSVNLIEGREFQFVAQTSQGAFADAAIAIDSTGDTPHLYVSDPYNHRVLGFKDLRKLKPGDRADIVLGQPDMRTALCNNPTGDPNQPTQSSLCIPMGLLVDSGGNLYVADSGNGRVLRFPAPFAHQGLLQPADLVLGQQNFTTKITDPSPRTMAAPYGLAFAGNNGLLVSDQGHNRVLFFPMTDGTFTAPADNGKAATKVFGQRDFISRAAGTGDASMNSPHHLGADTDGRPYVVDSGNNRVLIFDQILNTPNAGARAYILPDRLNSPRGIYVSPSTGEIWVTDTNQGTCKRYPKFDTLVIGGGSITTISAFGATLAVAQDQFGDLLVADTFNRVEFYYPDLTAVNGANFINHSLAPGLIATLYPVVGGQFGKETAKNDDLPNPIPLPKTLADVQVLFNDNPAPLYFVSPGQINFVVPMGAPTTGTADVQVVKVSSGQILAAGTVAMNSVSPGVFTLDATGVNRRAAVTNQDGSINDPTHPAKRGEIITIWATGQGAVPNAPADGDIPQGLVTTPYTPRVNIGGFYTDAVAIQTGDPPDGKFVKFSGLSPQFPGVWQINVQIPFSANPDKQVPFFILVNSVPSVDFATFGFRTVIAVSQ